MVGVAGKSNACKTCKKRKVRCDGGKPICDRCIKGGHLCEGYERVRQFRHLSALDHEALLARSQPQTSLTEVSRMLYRPFIEEDPNSHDIVWPTEQDPQDAGNGVSQAPELLPNLMYNYFPESSWRTAAKEPPISWLQAIGPWRQKHSSLNLAMSALSMACINRNAGNERLQSEGVAKYGRVLKDLQIILASDSLALEEQTLASCMTLIIFEACYLIAVMLPSGGNVCGWARHVEGISRLFQLRGPQLHVAELSHHLFLGFRSTAVIHALALRKPTYLAEPDWLVIPWSKQPKTDFHYLLDIMAQIPIFIDRADWLHKVSESNMSVATTLELLERGWELHLQLKDWYQELKRKSSEPFYIEKPSSLSLPTPVPTDLESVFPTFLHFQTFEVARMHLFYWTALLLLSDKILKTVASSMDPNKPRSSSSSIYPTFLPMDDIVAVRVQALNIAKLIARSMEFLLSEERFLVSEEMHIRGVLNTLFPLRTAIHVFSSEQENRMESWCRAVFDGLAERGYPFGQILCGWEWNDIPEFLSGNPLS